MKDVISNIVLSGAGATFLLFVVARLLPNDKLRAAGLAIGRAASSIGVHKLGRAFWEKIEDFLENSSGVFLVGLREGLDEDDQAGTPGGPNA
jgi:hypothetical protein